MVLYLHRLALHTWSDCALPAHHAAQTPAEAVGRAVLDYLPRFSHHHAAFCVAHDGSTFDHSGNAGMRPDHHQSHQPPHRRSHIYLWDWFELLPRIMGHHAGVLGLLNRDHHPTFHCPRSRYGCHRSLAGSGDGEALCEGVEETQKTPPDIPAEFKLQLLIFQRVIQLFHRGMYLTFSFVLVGCLGVKYLYTCLHNRILTWQCA
jgi:hypothetical protein